MSEGRGTASERSPGVRWLRVKRSGDHRRRQDGDRKADRIRATVTRLRFRRHGPARLRPGNAASLIRNAQSIFDSNCRFRAAHLTAGVFGS